MSILSLCNDFIAGRKSCFNLLNVQPLYHASIPIGKLQPDQSLGGDWEP